MLNQPQVGVSPFPQPSEYAKQYTDENVAQKNVLPPPPIPSEFTIFGEECNFNDDMIRSLQSQKMQQLFASSGDWRSELKQLNRSAMAAFLDLLDVLVRCPNHPERLEKISNIRLLFINMHHLINEYRPVQARDTLLMIVRDQVKAIEEVNQRFQFNLKMGCEVLMYSSDELTVQNEISHVIKQELVDADDGVESKMDIENVEGPIDNKSEFEALEVDETRETADEREEAVIREIAYLQFLKTQLENYLMEGDSAWNHRLNRRPFACTECLTIFRRPEIFYEHTQTCVIDEVEKEISAMFPEISGQCSFQPVQGMTIMTHGPPSPGSITYLDPLISMKPGLDAAVHDVMTRGIHPPDFSLNSYCAQSLQSSNFLCQVEPGRAKSLNVTIELDNVRTAKGRVLLDDTIALVNEQTVDGLESLDAAIELNNVHSVRSRGSLDVAVEAARVRCMNQPDGVKLLLSMRNSFDRSGKIAPNEEATDVEHIKDGLNSGVVEPDSYEYPSLSTDQGAFVIGALANARVQPLQRKIECPVCGFILYRHNFSAHYRIHTGELPYQCQFCWRRFRTTSGLKVHLRVHTGEKPYVCPKCKYSCSTKRNLDRHIVNNHIREGVRKGPRVRKSRYESEKKRREEQISYHNPEEYQLNEDYFERDDYFLSNDLNKEIEAENSDQRCYTMRYNEDNVIIEMEPPSDDE